MSGDVSLLIFDNHWIQKFYFADVNVVEICKKNSFAHTLGYFNSNASTSDVVFTIMVYICHHKT